MYAWVRYSKGSKPEDGIVNMDIDLIKISGEVCIKIKSLEFDTSAHKQSIKESYKDFEMLINAIQNNNSNQIVYTEIEDPNVSFDQLLKDVY